MPLNNSTRAPERPAPMIAAIRSPGIAGRPLAMIGVGLAGCLLWAPPAARAAVSVQTSQTGPAVAVSRVTLHALSPAQLSALRDASRFPEHEQLERPPSAAPAPRPEPGKGEPAASIPPAGRGPTGAKLPPRPDPASLTVFRNVEVTNYVANFYEDDVAASPSAVVFANTGALAFSPDAGKSWSSVPALGVDPAVAYEPTSNLFIYTSITLGTNNVLTIAWQTPEALTNSNGLTWNSLTFPVSTSFGSSFIDQPQIEVTPKYLLIGADFAFVGKKSSGALIRVKLADLLAGGSVTPEYVVEPTAWWVKPVKNSRDMSRFAWQVGSLPSPQLSVAEWPDGSSQVTTTTLNNAPSLSISNGATNLPNGSAWLPGNRDWTSRTTVSMAGGFLILAQDNSRYPANDPNHDIPQPVIDVQEFSITPSATPPSAIKWLGEDYLWDQGNAYAYPTLTGSSDGDTAMVYIYGGPNQYARPAVAIREVSSIGSGPMWVWSNADVSTTNGINGGIDYMGVRQIPGTNCFAAAVFSAVQDTSANGYSWRHWYVTFGRSDAQCP